jgi:uncharacterized membrane protein YedE/YeeE
MDAFSPVPALVGGVLIGLASALLWVGNGRIAGISGIFGQLVPASRDWLWRALFLVALVLGALVLAWIVPGLGVGGPGGKPAELAAPPSGWNIPAPIWLGIAGLLTGFGTRISNGCTSGHGICGLARLSPRSFVAVAIFFGVAIATVAITGIV